MKIMAITKRVPGATSEEVVKLRPAEAASVFKLVASGALREIYYCAERPAVVTIWECGSVDEVKKLVTTLPMVQANLIEFADLIKKIDQIEEAMKIGRY